MAKGSAKTTNKSSIRRWLQHASSKAYSQIQYRKSPHSETTAKTFDNHLTKSMQAHTSQTKFLFLFILFVEIVHWFQELDNYNDYDPIH